MGRSGGALGVFNGRAYEQEIDLAYVLDEIGYTLVSDDEYGTQSGFLVFSPDDEELDDPIALVCQQYDFYRFLDVQRAQTYLCSKKYIPDEALIDFRENCIHIFEKKFQESNGSADEKLQTGPFKLHQFTKLANSIGFDATYSYVCNSFFSAAEYGDLIEFYTDLYPEIGFYTDSMFHVEELGF